MCDWISPSHYALHMRTYTTDSSHLHKANNIMCHATSEIVMADRVSWLILFYVVVTQSRATCQLNLVCTPQAWCDTSSPLSTQLDWVAGRKLGRKHLKTSRLFVATACPPRQNRVCFLALAKICQTIKEVSVHVDVGSFAVWCSIPDS